MSDNNSNKDYEEMDSIAGVQEILDIASKNKDKNKYKNKENDVNNNKKKKKKLFSKKKNSGSNDFIELNNTKETNSSDFVIVGDNTSKLKSTFKKIKVVLIILLCIILTIITYISFSFRFINKDIKGANYHFGDISMVSRNYQPNLDELRFGDKIVYSNDGLDWLPIVTNYDLLTYESRNGAMIYAKDSDGKIHKIQSVDIDYILNN